MYTNNQSVRNLTTTHNKIITLYAVWEANEYNVTLNAGEYSMLEYIESTGTQFIDTGYAAKTENVKIHVEFEYTQFTDYGTIIGSQVGGNNLLIRQHSGAELHMYPYNGKLQSISVGTVYDMTLTLKNKSWETNINGATQKGQYSTSFINNLNICLFNSTNGENGTYGSQAISSINSKARDWLFE